MHNTFMKHGRDIKTQYFGSTSILLLRKDWNSIRLLLVPSFSKTEDCTHVSHVEFWPFFGPSPSSRCPGFTPPEILSIFGPPSQKCPGFFPNFWAGFVTTCSVHCLCLPWRTLFAARCARSPMVAGFFEIANETQKKTKINRNKFFEEASRWAVQSVFFGAHGLCPTRCSGCLGCSSVLGVQGFSFGCNISEDQKGDQGGGSKNFGWDKPGSPKVANIFQWSGTGCF